MNAGFTFFGHMAAGFIEPIGNPLPPGDTVTLRGFANGLDVGGTVTLDGVTYTGIGGLNSVSGALIEFVTTATLPSVLNAPASVLAPFMLNIVFFPSGVESHTLAGSGMARISLGEDKGFGVPSWTVTGIRADVSGSPGGPCPSRLRSCWRPRASVGSPAADEETSCRRLVRNRQRCTSRRLTGGVQGKRLPTGWNDNDARGLTSSRAAIESVRT